MPFQQAIQLIDFVSSGWRFAADDNPSQPEPLRTLMFTTLIEEFIRRAQSLKLDDPEDALILGLKSKKILTNSNH